MLRKPGRPRGQTITTEDQLGTLRAVAAYLNVGESWMAGVRRRALVLAIEDPTVPQPVCAGKTCARWIKEFIRHPKNAHINPTTAGRKVSTPPAQCPAASADGKSG